MARLMFYTGLVVGDIDIQSRHCHMESEEIRMSDYLIETKKLTKIYGEQAAVKEVDLHVKKGVSTDCWGVTGPEKPRL